MTGYVLTEKEWATLSAETRHNLNVFDTHHQEMAKELTHLTSDLATERANYAAALDALRDMTAEVARLRAEVEAAVSEETLWEDDYPENFRASEVNTWCNCRNGDPHCGRANCPGFIS